MRTKAHRIGGGAVGTAQRRVLLALFQQLAKTVRVIPAARNNTCEVIINVRGLKIPSANGVENETVMLTPAVNAIMVAYSPRSKPMISISNTGDEAGRKTGVTTGKIQIFILVINYYLYI